MKPQGQGIELPFEMVADAMYRVYHAVGGADPTTVPPLEALEVGQQAQWEAAARHAAALMDAAAEGRPVDLDALERQFPPGWRPRRLRLIPADPT